MSADWMFGDYKILKKIATGGTAEIFLAKRVGARGFEKLLAIKRVLPQFSENEDFISMFIDEARLAAQLNHRNIVQIYDFGSQQGSFYIAMEYVFGKDVRTVLRKSVEKQKQLPVAQAAYVIAEAARGLEYAHTLKDPFGNPLKIIHRDVSPQNILLSYEGGVLLADFGIAKAASTSAETRAGVLKGKILYMSPEQAWGQPVDRRSDLFSLGVVFYEMIACQRVFDAESEFTLLEKVRNACVEFPPEIFGKIPEPVVGFLKKALKKDPEERYQSAHEMRVDLENFLLTCQETSGERALSDYLKDLFQEEIEEEKKVVVESTQGPDEETPPLASGPEATFQERVLLPEPEKTSFLTSLKESLQRSGVRMRVGILLVLCAFGVLTTVYLLVERPWFPQPPVQGLSPSLSPPPTSSSPPRSIIVELPREEPPQQEPSKTERKPEPEDKAEAERKPEPERKTDAPAQEEEQKTAEGRREAQPGEKREKTEKPDKTETPEKTVAETPSRREEKRESPPVQKTEKAASKRPEAKPQASLAELVQQGPDLLRQNKHEIVLERISMLPDREKGNINVKILECFAHLKRWVEEQKQPGPFLKKILPPLKKPLWENLYDSLSSSGDRNGTPLLLRIVKDPEKKTRLCAISLLGSIGDQRALKDLQEIAASDPNEEIRQSATQAVSSIQSPSSAPAGPSSGPGRPEMPRAQ
jgi:serine/threonine protein kinase